MTTLLFSLILSLTFSFSVHAAENKNREKDSLRGQEMRHVAQEERKEMQKEIQIQKKAFREMVQEKRLELKDKIAKEKTELKTRLKNVSDVKKKEMVENIGNILNEINERRVTHATDVVEKVEKVLVRTGERMTRAGTRGVDINAIQTEYTAAEAAIVAAKAAIEAQSKKVYTMTVSTEAKLRDDVTSVRMTFHTDLKAMQSAVRAAHTAVQNVALALAKVPKNLQNETMLGTTTPETVEGAPTGGTQ